MSCDYPIKAWWGSLNPSGKRGLVFKHQAAWPPMAESPLELPCGRCLGCRLETSRRWALRCMHENKMHKESCFLTLTYNNESLPEFGTLVPRHLQLFHKRLHNRLLDQRGYGIRYYACGEYGDLNKRPHYHSLIFGYDFSDKVLYSKNARDEAIYTSETLNSLWHDGGAPFGDCKIGAVTFESAAYVARYCTKKVGGKKRENGHYEVYNSDGLIAERVPEFAHMSRRPGIGQLYYEKYGSEIRTHDNVIVNGKPVPSLRYYDNLGEKVDPDRMKWLKFRRREQVDPFEQLVDRRRSKEILRHKTHALKERKL